MYDHAKAAHHRILTASENMAEVGRLYVQLATALMCSAESPQRVTALRTLADSCEMAMTALSKGQKSRRNRFGNAGSPEKPSS